MKMGEGCCRSQCMASALLRWALGLLFLVAGLSKVSGLTGFVNGYLVPAFEETFLPAGLVTAYGYALPFAEIVLGALLLLGLWRTGSLLLTGLTLLSLAFGQQLLREHATVANIFLYVLMVAAALYMSDTDRWALDACRKPRD